MNKLFKRVLSLAIFTIFLLMLMSFSVFAVENENARYVMDAETMSTGHIAVLFIKGGTASSGEVTGGGTLYWGEYDPEIKSWDEFPVGEEAPISKDAAMFIDDDGFIHIVYVTGEDTLTYVYWDGTVWSYPEVIYSNDEGILYSPDIAITNYYGEKYVHIVYMDSKGSDNGYYYDFPDAMYTNLSETEVVIDGYGEGDGGEYGGFGGYTRAITPLKFGVFYDESYEEDIPYMSCRYESMSMSYNVVDTTYALYTQDPRSYGSGVQYRDDDALKKLYEACDKYLLINDNGELLVIDGVNNIDLDETKILFAETAIADMTMDSSNIYYAAIDGTDLLFYQNGTFIGKSANTAMLPNNIKCATVVTNERQFIIYTGADASKSIIITTIDDDSVDEHIIGDAPAVFTVTLDANNGTDETDAFSDQTVGTILTLASADDCGFTVPSGAQFVGWMDGKILYNEGDNYTVTGDATLVALWGFENAKYVMDAEVMSTGHIAILFIKGGAATSGEVLGGGTLYLGEYDPVLEYWEEFPVGEEAPVAKDAALAIDDDGVIHIAYITSGDTIAYTHSNGDAWTEPEYITSLEANGKPGVLYAPDIAIDYEGSVFIAYMDTQGDLDGIEELPDAMYADKAWGDFTSHVANSCTVEDGEWAYTKREVLPVKITIIEHPNPEYQEYYPSGIPYIVMQDFYSDKWGNYYETNYLSLSDDSLNYTYIYTDNPIKIYEECQNYTLINYKDDIYVVHLFYDINDGYSKVQDIDDTRTAFPYSAAADITVSDSNVYYAAIDGSDLLFFQEDTFIRGKSADTAILPSNNRCATVFTDERQFIIYTGANESKSIVITTIDNDEVEEHLISDATHCTVTYDLNNGEPGTTISVEDGDEITLPSDEGLTPPNGTAFAGWRLVDTDTIYRPTSTYVVTENVTFEAQWYEIITTANCTFAKPIAGQHPDMNPVSTHSDKYSVEVNYYYLYEAPYPQISSGDEYENGKIYSYRIRFKSKPGYIFNDDTIFTMNGDNTACYGRHDEREIQYTAYTLVDTLVVPEVVLPITGRSPNFTFEISGDLGYTISSFEWTDITTGYDILTNESKFLAGNTYQLEVCYVPKEGYVFDEVPNMDALISNVDDEKYESVIYSAGVGEKWRVAYFKFRNLPPLKGDVDRDGSITILDVRLLLQAYITNTWTEEDFPIMDMDDNLTVNILDVRLLLKDYINN